MSEIGKTAVGANIARYYIGWFKGCKFTSPGSGVLSSISLWIRDVGNAYAGQPAPTQFRVAIYRAVDYKLLGQSNPTSITPNSWNRATLRVPVSIELGIDYLLAWIIDTAPKILETSDPFIEVAFSSPSPVPNQTIAVIGIPWGDLPDPFPRVGSSLENNEYSIYGTYTAPFLATVRGIVTDQSTGLPIVGAVVLMDGYSTLTDASGFYQFVDVPGKVYMLTASAPNYRTSTVSVDASAGGTFIVDIPLVPSVVTLTLASDKTSVYVGEKFTLTARLLRGGVGADGETVVLYSEAAFLVNMAGAGGGFYNADVIPDTAGTYNFHAEALAVSSNTVTVVVSPLPPLPPILMEEHFNYPDGFDVTTLPTRPVPYSLIYPGADQWSIKNGELLCENRPVGYYSFFELGDRSWVNYKATMSFRLVGVDPVKPNTYAVILHFRKSTVSYGDRLDLQLVGPTGGNMWKIVAEKGGAWYDYRVGGKLPVNVWDGNSHTVAVECVGLNYTIFIDEVQVGAFSEPVLGITHDSGAIGLANMGSLVAFGDVVVTPPVVAVHTLNITSSPINVTMEVTPA